jgi:putative MATE family efflux protein
MMVIKEHRLMHIFWPLLIEVFLAVLIGLADTLMLYGVSKTAVGAVGSAATYMNFINVFFIVISGGMLAVFTQFVGAKKIPDAQKALKLSLAINASIAIVISIILILFAHPILDALMGESDLVSKAAQYLQIVGGTSIFMALTPIVSEYMRSFGHDKSPMFSSVIANIVNITINILAIFVFEWGVIGVAIATAVAHFVNFAAHIIFAWKLIPRDTDRSQIKSKVILNDALRVGLPSAFETFFYFGSMAAIISMLNYYDSTGLLATIRVTVEHIAIFAYIPAAALAHANALKTGFRCGRHNFNKCLKQTHQVALYGIGISVILAIILAIFARPWVSILTSGEQLTPEAYENIVRFVKICLWIHVGLEAGRATNMIIGHSLKASGDGWYVGIIGMISMSIIAVGGSYLFGFTLQLAVIGIFIALALDEIVRAILMLIRWNTRKWSNKTFL